MRDINIKPPHAFEMLKYVWMKKLEVSSFLCKQKLDVSPPAA